MNQIIRGTQSKKQETYADFNYLQLNYIYQ